MRRVLRPVGPKPARVYWVRRLVVLAAALAVLIIIIVLASKVFAGGDDPEPKESPEPAASQTTTPPPDAPCDPADLHIALNSVPESVDVGADAAFDIAVSHSGANPCTVDVGDETREVVVTSGADRIWSSADCASTEDASRLVLLRPAAANLATVIWSGERSNAKCAEDLPTPRPGTYKVQVALGDAESKPETFQIN